MTFNVKLLDIYIYMDTPSIISLGYQCYNSQLLGWIGLRKESLPFDFLKSPLYKVYDILNKLNSPNFNVDEFLNDLLRADKCGWNPSFGSDNKVAIYDSFYTGHFVKHRENQYVATQEIFDAFKRRVERLKEKFFNDSNVLVYNDVDVKNNEKAKEYANCLPSILKLNPDNKIVAFVHEDRKFDITSKNIEYVYIKTKLNSSNYSKDAREELLKSLQEYFGKYATKKINF
jgi:hypothetical protein